jgi:hypothetical protein
MTGFIEGKTTKENMPIKRVGYLISALCVVISTISMLNNWIITPWLFLITMYFLTGSLWIPVLIKPFYILVMKLRKKDNNNKKTNVTTFNPN